MENISKKISASYMEYVAQHRREPSVKQLLQASQVEESDFYKHFNTLNDVSGSIWRDMMAQTISRTIAQPVYEEYGARERMLSYCYTMLEVMKPERNYVIAALGLQWPILGQPSFINSFQKPFTDIAQQLVDDGIASGEVEQRTGLVNYYPKMLWGCMLFVLHFWAKDQSEGQEQTDTAVEKSVNLAFDLMVRGAIDSAFDFGKFLVQQVVKK